MPFVDPYVLDHGLDAADTLADAIYVCSGEPTSYALATSALAVGSKNFGVGGAVGAPSDAPGNGRWVATTAVDDGLASSNAEGTHAAVVDTINERLMAVVALTAPLRLTAGDYFKLPSFTVRLPALGG
jgi:hypothetical protein